MYTVELTVELAKVNQRLDEAVGLALEYSTAAEALSDALDGAGIPVNAVRLRLIPLRKGET